MGKWVSGGVKAVTTAGTPVQLSTEHILAHAVAFQALPLNTTRTVIGYDNTVRAGDGSTNPSGTVLAIMGKGSVTETPPAAGAKITEAPHGIDIYNLWVDAATSGEGIIWSYLLA